MKVVVLGAGVVGVTSAWYLCKAGHEVTVVERQPDVALETSYGNAGGICPSFAGPWAAPGMPFKSLKWMFQSTAPLKFRPKFDPYQWRWLAAFIANCTEERFQENKARMQRIAHYSRACLQGIRSELNISYENQSAGVLQIFQTESEVENGFLAAKVLSDMGIKHLIVDSNMAKELEPALAQSDVNVAGGLFMPEDETGDSRVFCKKMLRVLKDLGVDFQFDTEILNFSVSLDKIELINTNKGQIFGDSFVAALGPYVTKLLRPLRINLPIYPVKGYSITGQIIDEDASPLSSVMDEHTKLMVTRLGNRLRAAGAAEIVGFDRALPKAALFGVMNATKNLFPGAVNYNNCEVWCGFRPMTPDGPPKLGKTQFSNLFLNAGHGSNGWTQACGASKIVADILSNRAPDIDISGLTYFDTL
ncbi:D-amino acid dehydrogenase [Rhodobacteraceae bacterium nBUS_24]